MKAIKVSDDNLFQKWPPGSVKWLHVLQSDYFFFLNLTSDGSDLTDNTVGFQSLDLLVDRCKRYFGDLILFWDGGNEHGLRCLFQIGETLPNSLLSLFAIQVIISPIPFNLLLYKLGNIMWWSCFVK